MKCGDIYIYISVTEVSVWSHFVSLKTGSFFTTRFLSGCLGWIDGGFFEDVDFGFTSMNI